MKSLTFFYFTLLSIIANGQTSAYSQPAQYNDYIEPINIRQVERTLSTLDSKYKNNLKSLNDKSENINKLVDLLYEIQGKKFSTNQTEYLNSYYAILEKITKRDIANNTTTMQILKTMNNVENTLYKWLKN